MTPGGIRTMADPARDRGPTKPLAMPANPHAAAAKNKGIVAFIRRNGSHNQGVGRPSCGYPVGL